MGSTSPITLRFACTLGVSPIHKGAFGACGFWGAVQACGKTPQSALCADSSPFRGALGSESFGAYVATQKLATPVANKSPPHPVSYSEAASGLLTGVQGTDAVTNLPGSWDSVRL